MSKTTFPSVPITDGAFQYSNSASTDITKTWERARERIREQEALMTKSEPQKRGRLKPSVMPMRKVRAGTTNHLSLPLF